MDKVYKVCPIHIFIKMSCPILTKRRSKNGVHEIAFEYKSTSDEEISDFLSNYGIKEYNSLGDDEYFFTINDGDGLDKLVVDAYRTCDPDGFMIIRGTIKPGDYKYFPKGFPDEVDGFPLGREFDFSKGKIKIINKTEGDESYKMKKQEQNAKHELSFYLLNHILNFYNVLYR